MRILVVGAGVIGSVYGHHLACAGHDVQILARGDRLGDLRRHGLVLENAATGQRDVHASVRIVTRGDLDSGFDLIMVPVRHDQLEAAVPLLTKIDGDVLFFGNAAGLVKELTAALGERALFGFPAVAGARDGAVIRYVAIRQQPTMLAEPSGAPTRRLHRFDQVFGQAGFRTQLSSAPEDWLIAHTAFVVPIAVALYRVGVDPQRLAKDRVILGLMVDATSQSFRVLRAQGNRQISRNLLALYLALPGRFTRAYWRRVLNSPNGELWFGAHTRAAPEEMLALTAVLLSHVSETQAPALAALAAR